MRPALLGTLLLSSLVMWGCGGEDDRPAIWSYISPAIIQPNCATSSCHSRGSAIAALDLSTAEAGYHNLLEQMLPAVPGSLSPRDKLTRPLVTPGNPTESRIVNMMRAVGTDRMPPDRPLAEADIALIEKWILEGAQND